MKAKFYVLAMLLGGLTIFVWGAVSHMALPFWENVMHEVPNEQAVVDALKAGNVENGIYYGMQGLFMSVFLRPDMAEIGMEANNLVLEFVSNALLALVIAWLLVRASVRGTLNRAWFAFMVGLAAWLSVNVSYWNWYNFPFAYILLEFVDLGIGAFLAGLVIAWLMEKQRVVTA